MSSKDKVHVGKNDDGSPHVFEDGGPIFSTIAQIQGAGLSKNKTKNFSSVLRDAPGFREVPVSSEAVNTGGSSNTAEGDDKQASVEDDAADAPEGGDQVKPTDQGKNSAADGNEGGGVSLKSGTSNTIANPFSGASRSAAAEGSNNNQPAKPTGNRAVFLDLLARVLTPELINGMGFEWFNDRSDTDKQIIVKSIVQCIYDRPRGVGSLQVFKGHKNRPTNTDWASFGKMIRGYIETSHAKEHEALKGQSKLYNSFGSLWPECSAQLDEKIYALAGASERQKEREKILSKVTGQ